MPTPRVKRAKDWKCQECGKRFTLERAEWAASLGCSCGSVDIDLDPEASSAPEPSIPAMFLLARGRK